MSIRIIFCVLYFLLLSIISFSQPDLKFVRFTTEQGLTNNDVLSICQDQFGFMWFGTKGGFSRFDGIDFTNFNYDKFNSQAISGEWVNQIVCDNQNRLWFGMTDKNYFVKYDYNNGKFENLSETVLRELDADPQNYVFWNIFADSEGFIWLPNLISYFNPKDTSVIKIHQNGTAEDYYEDSEGNIWLATSNNGILKYNKKTNSVTEFRNNPNNPKSLSSDKCHCIFIDSDNELWVGTNNGLNRSSSYLTDKPEFIKYYSEPDYPNSITNNLVYDIEEGNEKQIFIGTVNGLSILDKKENKIYRYYHDEHDDESINSNLIRTIYKDRKNNIWIATDDGIGKLVKKSFKTFSYSKYKNSLSHNKVQYICEAPNKEIWIATPKGIDIYNRHTNKFSFLTGVSTKKNDLFGPPLVLMPGVKNGIWIGTWGGGISYFDITNNKLINYYDKGFLGDIVNSFFIFRDSKNNYWYSSSNQGIYLINQETQEKIYFKKAENGLGSLRTRYIMEDSQNDIWFATLAGLFMLTDICTGEGEFYLKDLFVHHTCETDSGLIWAATNQGLFCLNKKTKKITSTSYIDYLKSTVFSIVSDDNHNIWATTFDGCAKLALNYDSVVNITVYRKEDGLDAGVFLPGSSAKLSDGNILLGGTKGFSMFNPREIESDTSIPEPYFTKLNVLGKEIKPGQEVNRQIILNKSITVTKSLILNHNNNAFSIEFAGLNCRYPKYNTFLYQLEGYEKTPNQWHNATTKNPEAEFMNLPPGDYLLKLKVANSYGIWCKKPVELLITILPPWWKTLWFTSLWFGSVAFMVYFIIKRRFQTLKEQKIRLEQTVTQRTLELKDMNHILSERKEELEIQMNKLTNMNYKLKAKSELISEMANKIHESDQRQLQFFANISHEFKTPLTLIIGPLENYLNSQTPKEWEKLRDRYIHPMYRNAKRLLRLINQVIDIRKMDQGLGNLNLAHNNIISYINEIIDSFGVLADNKGVELKFTIGEKLTFQDLDYFNRQNSNDINIDSHQHKILENFWFDPVIMEKIMYNLISNAIKYTPEGGIVNVIISIRSNQLDENAEFQESEDNDALLIIIDDTGVGIKEENINKIFDRFYRIESEESYKNEGAGIGLAYTKELVDMHKGKITVQSQIGKGSRFILSFPIEINYDTSIKENNYNNENSNIEHEGSFKYHHKPEQDYFNLDYINSMIADESTLKNKESAYEKNGSTSQQNNNAHLLSILLVEDNTDLRSFMKSELEDQYFIYEAENGEEGWEIVNKENPNLVISDIMMPVLNGIELCKKIKSEQDTSHIPVIIITAKSEEENIFEGLETGANDYINKPFSINILKAKIKNLFQVLEQMKARYNQSVQIVPTEITHSKLDQEFIKKALDIINTNMQNPLFDNDKFAELMNCSKATIYRKTKAITNQSVSEFIRSIRLKAAAQMFLEGNDNIAEVCFKVGFKYQSILSRYFSEMFGKTPSQFIKDRY